MKKKSLIRLIEIVFIAIFIVLAILLLEEKRSSVPGGTVTETEINDQDAKKTDQERQTIKVREVSFEKKSSDNILIMWSDELDPLVQEYRVMRKPVSEKNNEWTVVDKEKSDQIQDGNNYRFEDHLQNASPQQYLYRVDITATDKEAAAEDGEVIIASNISVCIDPGHYRNASTLSGNNIYGYDEGTFMLEVGLKLRDVLKEQYGISCIMTREKDDILLDGYKNADVDNVRISIRGEMAVNTDLFISLHTNANLDNANGYPAANQPVELNKTLVFVNQKAANSKVQIRQANAIGEFITLENYNAGLSFTDQFDSCDSNSLRKWSDEFNDSLNVKGTVCYRIGDSGKDYYGVLRGANEVGVPGMIVEHGFHTIEDVRKACENGKMAEAWAAADAAGIAYGYMFERYT